METNYQRYDRQLILKNFGEVAQKKLASARVLVIGAGGLGCPCLLYLGAAGVGTIGIADDDVIQLNNLQRQILYETADVGKPKCETSAARLKKTNPDIRIIEHPARIDTGNALGIIDSYDVVVDGTDNFQTRYLVNDACVLLGKPYVYGAVSGYEGQAGVFNFPAHPSAVNYRDLFPEPPKPGEVADCSEGGVLGVLPGIIGTMQAAEVIKIITGIGEVLTGKILSYSFLTNTFYEASISPSQKSHSSMPKKKAAFLTTDYPAICGLTATDVKEIDIDTLIKLYGNEGTALIDVREYGELPEVTSLVHQKIPMSGLEKKLSDISADDVVFICQHGIRSLHAGELLLQAAPAKRVYSLKGGLVKWLQELEQLMQHEIIST